MDGVFTVYKIFQVVGLLMVVSVAGCTVSDSYSPVSRVDAKAHFKKANNLYENERYSEALTEYLNAITGNPENEDYLTGLGQVYFALAEYDRAIKSYQKLCRVVLERHGKGSSALAGCYHMQGLSYEKLQDKVEALKYHRYAYQSMALALPNNYREQLYWLQQLTNLLIDLEEFERAAQYYTAFMASVEQGSSEYAFAKRRVERLRM